MGVVLFCGNMIIKIYNRILGILACNKYFFHFGAFAADERECVILNGECVCTVTDRLIFVVDGDLVFFDFVCKFIGDIGQEQGSVSITAELIGRCAIQVPFALENIGAARTALDYQHDNQNQYGKDSNADSSLTEHHLLLPLFSSF